MSFAFSFFHGEASTSLILEKVEIPGPPWKYRADSVVLTLFETFKNIDFQGVNSHFF